jgi:hypothetical protein
MATVKGSEFVEGQFKAGSAEVRILWVEENGCDIFREIVVPEGHFAEAAAGFSLAPAGRTCSHADAIRRLEGKQQTKTGSQQSTMG